MIFQIKIVVGSVAEETVELVKASFERVIRLIESEMSFAENASLVTRFSKKISDCDFVLREAYARIGGRIETESLLVSAGQ